MDDIPVGQRVRDRISSVKLPVGVLVVVSFKVKFVAVRLVKICHVKNV